MNKTIALGCFDGLHTGHAAVLSGATHCLLFDVHPQALLGGEPPPRLLDDHSRDGLLRALGVAPLILPFAEIHALPPRAFVEEILVKRLSATGAACGYNYRFGAKAAGDADTLTRLCEANGIDCRVVPPVLWEDAPVSATRIREALLAGDTAGANAMLGRPFGYNFPVLRGDGRGRLLGYPTANQSFPTGFLVPRRGVYASRVTLAGEVYHAMTNIGLRPTFDGGRVLSETHIFDFKGDLYGQRLPVELLRFIRDERAFAGAQALTAQLERDAKECAVD